MNMTAGLLGLFLNGILILFLSGYFVVEAKTIWSRLLIWVPENNRQRVANLISPLEYRMGGYIRGQLLVAVAVGLFFTIGFSLLRLHYGLLMGVLAGLLNLVPYVGSMIATITATVVAFNQDPKLAIIVLALYAIEQWLESTFIVPLLLGRQVSLHPLVVLFAILSGASLMGIPGALISVPVVSAVLFLAEEFYLKANKYDELQSKGLLSKEEENISNTGAEVPASGGPLGT
jgi:predicted PurR-regulated permease PerM